MRGRVLAVVVTVLVAVADARADAPVSTSFPTGFPVIQDQSLGVPVIGFGGAGPVSRVPVVFLHGNNDTPYPTTCNNAYGEIHGLAEYLHRRGYARSELWGLGYQGEQCDLLTTPGARAGEPHTVRANVAELRAFVAAVRAFTGAPRVDVVGHSLGVVLAREWLRQDDAHGLVRRVIGIDGPNHGIVNCSPSPGNYYVAIGFTPESPVCQEFGAADTPLLGRLNFGDETPGPTEWTVLRNADTSFVYFSRQDGPFPPVPAQDSRGRPHDFSQSARLEGARNIDLTGQAQYGSPGIGTAHNGILSSPETAAITYEVLSAPEPPAAPAVRPRPAPNAVTLRARRSGRVVRAAGRVVAEGCGGSVLVRVSRAGRTLAARRVALDDRCRFSVTIRFARAPRGATVAARFLGTAALRPRSSRAVRLR